LGNAQRCLEGTASLWRGATLFNRGEAETTQEGEKERTERVDSTTELSEFSRWMRRMMSRVPGSCGPSFCIWRLHTLQLGCGTMVRTSVVNLSRSFRTRTKMYQVHQGCIDLKDHQRPSYLSGEVWRCLGNGGNIQAQELDGTSNI
jgi:hypothetical protein